MNIAYLTDRDALGGGMEYVRRKQAQDARDGFETRTFFSVRGECRAEAVNAWGADRIVVGHLRALLQLFRNPLARPKGQVTFVVHGIHLRKFDFLPKTPANRLKRFLRLNLERWLYRKCNRLVALTATDRADILRLYGANLDVVIEPNTLDGWVPRLADCLPPGVEGPFTHVVIGRFDFQKGQDRWIRRMGEEVRGTREKGRGTGGTPSSLLPRTLFIGDGAMLEPCRRLARELGVADRCVFAGAVPEAERYLKCADVVVSPSRWEGMPYLMMKARALGCRVLATDCPGNRDVLAGYANWEKLEL